MLNVKAAEQVPTDLTQQSLKMLLPVDLCLICAFEFPSIVVKGKILFLNTFHCPLLVNVVQ